MPNTRRALAIDLNSDMGEGYGAWRMGDDSAVLKIVTSANVACGMHAGDPEIMAQTFALAKEQGVAVGAHPGYPDMWGFGRRVVPFTAGEVERLVAYQIGAAQALSTNAGHPITYVKAHGALANLAQENKEVASAIARAIRTVDPGLICLTFAVGNMIQTARELGLKTCAEIFADRAYTEDGNLVSRKTPGAVIHNAKEAAARALRMVQARAIETVSSRLIPCEVESICVHSDTPSAVEMAAELRRTLESAGVEVRPFSAPGSWPRLDWLK